MPIILSTVCFASDCQASNSECSKFFDDLTVLAHRDKNLNPGRLVLLCATELPTTTKHNNQSIDRQEPLRRSSFFLSLYKKHNTPYAIMPKRKRRNSNNNKPLVPPPNKTMSRKRARVVTTQFHKLERQRAAAEHAAPEQLAAVHAALTAMGGRQEYQRASQVSTAFHSTSKWVLGYLLRNGWYYGIRVEEQEEVKEETKKNAIDDNDVKNSKRKKKERRPTRILEIGAINTELLDAAAKPKQQSDNYKNKNRLNLDVRALDLHCMDRRIEKADFLQIPVSHADENQRYDVIVCSMVLNCVPTASARGEMVSETGIFVLHDDRMTT